MQPMKETFFFLTFLILSISCFRIKQDWNHILRVYMIESGLKGAAILGYDGNPWATDGIKFKDDETTYIVDCK
jgi:hypothetical protein